jgi:hypothetical protein
VLSIRVRSSFLAAAVLAAAVLALIAPGAGAQSATDDFAQMLDKTGYTFVKVDDNVYEVPASGKNLKQFTMRITQAEHLLIIVCKVADRRAVNSRLALRALELNSNYDIVKFALSKDMLYARIDVERRVVDVAQLKFIIEAMAHVIDDSYPQIKGLVVGATKRR